MASISYNFKMTDADIAKGITSIGKRAASIRKDIHSVMVSITRNWAQSGAVNVACDRMTQLLAAVDGSHKQKLVNWAQVHCSFDYDSDEEKFVYTSTTLTPEQWQAGKDETMFELTKDTPVKAFNFNAELAKLLDRAKKRATAKNKSPDDVIDPTVLEAVSALLKDDDS